MRHFHITLARKDRSVREWSLWADTLTIGSHPHCSIVLPSPIPSVAATVAGEGFVDLPIGRFLIHEDTALWESLWRKARDRMAVARLTDWREPGAGDKRRTAALVALGVAGILAMAGMRIIGIGERRVASEAIPDYFIPIPVDVVVPPPPPPQVAELERDRALRPDEKQNQDPNADVKGGSSETRTVQASKEFTPANVMTGSVMDQVDKASDALLGELVDPNEANLLDVMLAGNMGSMRRGDGGRGMKAGDGDRMAALGNIGLGHGGRDGFGRGVDGAVRGPKQVGGGAQIVTRPVVRPPRPTDITLGEDVGSRSPESILRVIRGAVGGFQYTYQKYLKKNEALGGKVSLKFTIAPSGDIVAIKVVDSNTGDTELDEEILDKARRMKFDAIEKGNVTVTYAFILDRQ